jgi:hypothetical protein
MGVLVKLTNTKERIMQLSVVDGIVSAATKGANIHIAWHRACKVKKNVTDTITKAVKTVGRVGIDYNNQKAVQEKRESGELPTDPQPIWHGKGEWAKWPYLIRHKDTGQHYVRLYAPTGSAKPEVQFYRNGVAVSKESIENDVLASEKKSEHGDCFCCKVEDMTDIHWSAPKPKAEAVEAVEVEAVEAVEIDAPLTETEPEPEPVTTANV